MTVWLNTLWEILSNPDNSRVVSWNEVGDGFIIYSIKSFEREVLSKYYKHS